MPTRKTKTTEENTGQDTAGRFEVELSLPFSAGIATYPPGATFGPRQMRDYEFVWLIQGDAEYRRAKTWVSAPQGSVVLCRPGAVDFFKWDTARRTRHGFFHFQVKSWPPNWPLPEVWPLVSAADNEEILLPLFRLVLASAGRGDVYACRMAAELMLHRFTGGESTKALALHETLPEPVDKASEFLFNRLEADPAAKITLNDLARAAYVSPEHLCRLFKDSTNRSPLETVRLARLDRAAVLLARSNYSINEIATMCGFASPFHFSRRFKAAYHTSPRALRELIRDGGMPPTPRLLRMTRRL